MSEASLSRRAVMASLATGAAGLAAGGGLLALASPAEAQKRGRAASPGTAIEAAIKEAYGRYRTLQEGKNADYIPALAEVSSAFFGIAVAGNDSKVHETGDSRELFSIQSISKVFTAALVMQESGGSKIEDSVGVDATGQVFNSINAVEQYRGKEMNPFVNPGAIATVGNVKGSSPDEVWAKILQIHSDFAGRQLDVNQPVYKSESDTNHRNRAISALMSAYERFPMDPTVAVDLYTRQCSINVSAHDLAVMGATLAFGGRNPVTGKQVIDRSHVPGLLAIMATAGMYDDSGKWLFRTGLPTKSGVGGGLVGVAPGKFGIGTFAPPLDGAGNSVRGQRAITDIVRALNANPYAQTG
ncbi:MAG TPA: glutaminase A [Allosphingosinicella sp.]|nr:glutaminase A [Allosphingosinicella sp.]